MKKTAPFFIILAGVLWGLMGIFVRGLGTYGFSPLQIASLRIMVGAVLLAVISGVFDRKKLKIEIRDIGWFLGLGIGSILLFTVCYFTTINLASLSVAAILLYTAPIMVMLMSLVLFREKLTKRKTAALVMAFLGCVLAAGIGGDMQISVRALGFGLMSGFGYGLYSILGTYVLRKYPPLTVTTYAFLFGGAGALLICRPADILYKIRTADHTGKVLLLIFMTAFVTAVLPYLFYTTGLASTKASSASIMASVEPVVATITGILVFHEPLTIVSGAGVLLVLGGITLLNLTPEG